MDFRLTDETTGQVGQMAGTLHNEISLTNDLLRETTYSLERIAFALEALAKVDHPVNAPRAGAMLIGLAGAVSGA